MNKQKSNPTSPTATRVSRGVTLVELLVVISILTVIFAVMIPRLRAVNEDRNIREAARVVASAFSKASSRAINEGLAGLMIVPNPNFQQATSNNFGVTDFERPFFAGTRIFQMRRLPPYIGDDESSVAWSAVGNDGMPIPVVIDRPFGHVLLEEENLSEGRRARLVIRPNDEISFGGSSYRYRILGVSPNGEDGSRLDLTLDLNGPAPLPSLGRPRDVEHDGNSGVPFVIHRQPRVLQSSEVELPEGYLIDLRYSGPLLAGGGAAAMAGCPHNQNPPLLPSGGESEPRGIILHFDANGGVSRMFFADAQGFGDPGGGIVDEIGPLGSIQPIGALHWLVTEYDPNAFGADGNYATPTDEPIFNPINKWVTVDHLTGGVNVASAAVPQMPVGGPPLSLIDAIVQSRAIANERQSASQ